MTDKEKIRAEIERRLQRENEILWNAKKRGTYPSPSCEYNLLTLTSLRDFIDSLSEAPDKSLEEAAEEWCKTNNKGIALSADKKSHYLAEGVDAFKAGAEWQKEKAYGIAQAREGGQNL